MSQKGRDNMNKFNETINDLYYMFENGIYYNDESFDVSIIDLIDYLDGEDINNYIGKINNTMEDDISTDAVKFYVLNRIVNILNSRRVMTNEDLESYLKSYNTVYNTELSLNDMHTVVSNLKKDGIILTIDSIGAYLDRDRKNVPLHLLKTKERIILK